MFTILRRDVGGRKLDRYYISWEEAKEALLFEVDFVKTTFDWKVKEKIDRFNSDKGFYEFQIEMKTDDNETAMFSLIDGYFEDE